MGTMESEKMDLSDQILKLSIKACDMGEKIGKENQRKFCLKNIQSLCVKTKRNLSKPEYIGMQAATDEWLLKCYMYSFIRISDGWKCLHDMLHEEYDAYKDIEEKYYSENLRNVFTEWQTLSNQMLERFYEIFQQQKDGVTNLTDTIVESKTLPEVSSQYRSVRKDWEDISSNVIGEDMDSQWRIAIQSLPKTINDTKIGSKALKNNRKMKKLSLLLLNAMDEEFLLKLPNKHFLKVFMQWSVKNDSVTITEIRNKFKKIQYTNLIEILKDMEELFLSAYKYFQKYPNEELESIINMAHEKLLYIITKNI